uniref:Uncharacterized protein n=1 Tax=Arundo donax TaxID=35708 RepID=A0A0A9GSM2_ARUDO
MADARKQSSTSRRCGGKGSSRTR